MNGSQMLSRVLAAALLAGCGGRRTAVEAPPAPVPAAAPAPAGPAVALLDGTGLDGWTPVGDPQMMLLPDGSLGSQRGRGVLMYTGRTFRDFVLELDFLPEGPTAGAGVLLRVPGTPASLEEAERGAYEIRLGDEPPPPVRGESPHYIRSMYVTGAVNRAVPDTAHHADQMSPRRPVLRAPGEWNRLRVEAVGPRLRVHVNGELVNDFFGRLAAEGQIGLVNRTPDFAVRFRDLRVTPVEAPGAPRSLGELFAVREPREPIRVLMVTATHGFRHTYGIQGAVEVMEELERTTELRVDTTENLANLNPANLARYDLLFFANSTLRIAPADTTQAARAAVRIRNPVANPVTPEQQRAVMDFVRSGKGVVVAHAGLDSSYGWDEYREMVGGGLFESHPWTKHLRVRVDEPAHPGVRHLGDQFWIREEFYILDRSPRAGSRVLLTLDNATFGAPNMGRLPAPGRDDHPVSWTRTHGRGRVFATILGHFRDTWHRPEFVQHLLTGMRMAAGRIPMEGGATR